jgi:hypothetical protein
VDEETLQFYRSNAQSYADWAKAPSTRLRAFLALLPPDGSILIRRKDAVWLRRHRATVAATAAT